MLRFALVLSLAVVVTVTAGCGPKEGPRASDPAGDDPAALAEGKKLMQTSEPTGARSVIAVREKAKNGDEVVVAGQVGGASRPFTKGRASFLIVDSSLKPTAECDCPWDFCELDKKVLANARISVKFVDGAGNTLAAGAREMFGLKELSSVVIKGKVHRDDKDNVVVVASGIYVRP